jgi:glycine cleavage system H protein
MTAFAAARARAAEPGRDLPRGGVILDANRHHPLKGGEAPMIPNNLRYTSDHEWVAMTDSGTLRVGITDYAQNSLGDIVFVQMPELGSDVVADDAVGEVESTKSVSDVLAPVDGTVVARNEQLDDAPELVNSDPYGEGWLYELEPADPAAVDALMDADAYAETIGES